MTFPLSIILNNKPISAAEISTMTGEKIANPIVPDWEKELFQFLNEWFSKQDYITAETSGSTGEPKTIELAKKVMLKSALRTLDYFGLEKNDRLLLSLPCRYIAGKMMVVRAIIGKMNLITVDPTGNFDLLEEESIDLGAMVPNQVFKLLDQPSGINKLQKISNLLVGGSGISKALSMQISSLSNRVVSTYGMTETASHIAIRELSGERKSEFHHCLPEISVSLSEAGCLQIHLPEFAEPLQTNDLAELQSSSCFRILGRADSVIISGGIKYSPEVIEKKLESLINQRFVISSFPDKKLGEKLMMVIEGDFFDTTLLEQKLTTLLTPYERPKTICFMKHFPETLSGKIIRREVSKILSDK